jgi:hypothetical protein
MSVEVAAPGTIACQADSPMTEEYPSEKGPENPDLSQAAPCLDAWSNKVEAEESESKQNPKENQHPKDYPENYPKQPKPRQSKASLFGFTDPEEIKKKVQQQVLKPDPYNVANFYWETGRAQEIARHSLFENITLAVISLNAVYIAVDTDWNKPEPLTATDTNSLTDSSWFFQFMEHAFCVYFTFEIVIRFLAFKKKSNCRKDAWFVFDSFLVTLMVLETWVLLFVGLITGGGGENPLGNASILRLFRLLRLSRLMRMLRSLPELMILIKGMVAAMKSVFYVMCLLMILTYVFAIAFTQLSSDNETLKTLFFANVAHAMYSLMIYATFCDNLAYFMDSLRLEKWYLLVLAMVFCALASLTVLNMLIGVLCEVVSAVAQEETEEFMMIKVAEKLHGVALSLDKDFNEKVSYNEFQKLIDETAALDALAEVGVNPTGLLDFADLIFFENGQPLELPFDVFMDKVLDLRDDNQTTVKDILTLWMRIKNTTNAQIEELDADMEEINLKLDNKTTSIENELNTALSELAKIVG